MFSFGYWTLVYLTVFKDLFFTWKLHCACIPYTDFASATDDITRCLIYRQEEALKWSLFNIIPAESYSWMFSQIRVMKTQRLVCDLLYELNCVLFLLFL